MMKKSILIFSFFTIFSISFLACDNTDIEDVCGTDKPLKDIEWLKEIKKDFSSSQVKGRITQYDYNNETVFSIEDCYEDCSDRMSTVYNCEQEILCQFGGIAGLNTCPDFADNATNKIVLYED